MQGRKNWKYINQINFDHYWSSLFEAMGARKKRIYWDQEEDPKQEREDDCGC